MLKCRNFQKTGSSSKVGFLYLVTAQIKAALMCEGYYESIDGSPVPEKDLENTKLSRSLPLIKNEILHLIVQMWVLSRYIFVYFILDESMLIDTC